MKWFAELLPFIEPYPAWVKALISSWVLLTAVCIVALIVGKPSATRPNITSADMVWLKISKVEIFSQRWSEAGVRVTANINGNSFTYPSVGGVLWVVPGPDMSPGLFKLPASNVFEVSFSMLAKQQGTDEGRFASQRTTVIRNDQLPHADSYSVHQVGRQSTRSGAVAAQISYVISHQPD